MSLWPYSGTNSTGSPVKGKIPADDAEGAKARLEAMGIKWEKVGDEVVEEGTRVVPVEAQSKEQANGTIKSFQNTVEIPRPNPVLPQKSKTRQFVLFGPGPQVKSESLPLLERGGRVIHASMSPDSSGRPHVLLVIEAEEKT